MSFVEREIDFVISIAQGATGEQPGQDVTLSGYRSRVSIDQYGGASMGHARISIYGVPLDLMKRLTTIGPVAAQIRAKNQIKVLAGNQKDGMSTVFTGTIWTAWTDFHGMPDVCLQIDAYSALSAATEPATTTSFQGTVSIHNIMQVLAKKAGLQLQDSGVTGSLSNPAFNGSAMDQIAACADAANINYSPWLGKLLIWPRSGHLTIEPVTVSPTTGMIGYPSFSSQFVVVDSEFLPTMTVGGRMEIKGSQLGAMVDGTWVAAVVQHSISAQLPGGPWFTHTELVYRAA